jgi:probable rRNA maturation factor
MSGKGEITSMSFYLEEECEIPFSFDYAKLAEKVVSFCLSHENFPYEAEVNLTLTDNEGIHAINKEQRGIDRPTDVLSFPMLTYQEAGNFDFLADENDDDFNPDTGEALLGDIVISVEKVLEQAESYGHSEEREFAFLITHSMLHLFGYDHMEPEDAEIMEEKQRRILEELQITRQNRGVL